MRTYLGWGGWKYNKKYVNDEGFSVEDEFILKPIFERITPIDEPDTPNERYRATFEIVDYNFETCKLN